MAWTSLSFAYGSVLTSTKMTQLYDDITAAMHGETNAPQLKPEAFQYQIGTALVARSMKGKRTAAGYAILKENGSADDHEVQLIAPMDCTVTVRIHGKDTASTSNLRIYVNGSAVGTVRSISTSWNSWDEDITVNAGDRIELWGSTSGLPTVHGYLDILSNVRMGWVAGRD